MVIQGKSALASAPRSVVGGKAAGLAALLRSGCRVPPYFVVPASADLGEPAIRSAIADAAAALGGERLAVRSSALAEDGGAHSFAGQLESFLGPSSPEALLDAIERCRASGRSERVLAYCEARGIAPGPVAVVVQRLIEGEASGVMFTRDPEDPERVLISGGWGLGEGVVQGLVDCDTFRVDREGAVAAEVVEKPQAMAMARGAPALGEVPASRRFAPVLTESMAARLAAMGRQLERDLGRPQDVEWTVDQGEIYLLQTRPITAAVPFGPRLLWDNSNIVESYAGVTTPLTYSFARNAYSIVYKLFCEVMGVDGAVIRANDAMFRRMIGLIQGRVFYNLNSWYRVLTLLPGYQWNRAFMEQMMGVSEVADDQDAEASGSAWQRRLKAAPRLVRLLGALAARVARLDRDVAAFHRHFNTVYRQHRDRDLSALTPTELVAVYSDLEQRLLWEWTTPIVNDFFTMIFHGVLRSLCEKWLEDTDVVNTLLAGEGGLESTAPTLSLLRQSAAIRADPALLALFEGGASDAEVLAEASALKAFASWLEHHIDAYGDRSGDELKLETTTPRQDPPMVVGSLRALLRAAPMDPHTFGAAERQRREAAEAAALTKLTGLRRRLFAWVLDRARTSIRNRENLRFLRTRIFGLARDIFRALGDQMVDAGALTARDQIHYLTVEELLGWVDGTLIFTDLEAMAALRAEEFKRWRELPAPDERFHTLGPVHRHNRFRAPGRVEGEGLSGIPCYPGVVEGPVAVIHDPADGARSAGRIMVTERTDPGWVPLFPGLAGLLVERGSALSHSAVVAREMGIPAVVGIRGLTAQVSDGDAVRMDGEAGTVERLEEWPVVGADDAGPALTVMQGGREE
jgi:phosphohistidine swiveling domain-containing protein